MATIKAEPTFDGIPQELRDQIYLEVALSATDHAFTLRPDTFSDDKDESELDSIFLLDHPMQQINHKILLDFEAVALSYVRNLRVNIVDLNFAAVKHLFEEYPGVDKLLDKYPRALHIRDFASQDMKQPTRNLAIHFSCTDRFPAALGSDMKLIDRCMGIGCFGGIAGSAEYGIEMWAVYCFRNRLRTSSYSFDDAMPTQTLRDTREIMRQVSWDYRLEYRMAHANNGVANDDVGRDYLSPLGMGLTQEILHRLPNVSA